MIHLSEIIHLEPISSNILSTLVRTMVTTRKKKRVNYTKVANGVDSSDDKTVSPTPTRKRSRCRKKRIAHKKKSVPQDVIVESPPPPPPALPRSVIYRIHIDLKLKASVTPVKVQFEDFNMKKDSEDCLISFFENTIDVNGIYNVVSHIISENDHVPNNAEWDSEKDCVYFCKTKRSSTDEVFKTKGKEFCEFRSNVEVREYMENYAYYPRSELKRTKVFIDVFVKLRKSKRKKESVPSY